MALNNQDIIAEAKTWLGIPYVLGGNSRAGTDCSGLVQQVFGKFGVHLPRTTIEQLHVGVDVPPGNIQPGDCVYFGDASDNASQHTGIIVTPLPPPATIMIDAPHTGAVVRQEPIAGFGHIIGFKRFWSGNAGPGETSINIGGAEVSPGDIAQSVPGLGQVLDALNQLANTFGGLVKIISAPVHAIEWLSNPQHIFRIMKAVLGMVAMGLGVYFINEDMINSAAKATAQGGKKVAKVAKTVGEVAAA